MNNEQNTVTFNMNNEQMSFWNMINQDVLHTFIYTQKHSISENM